MSGGDPFGDREALGRLLGLFAHDLRNPLAILSGNLAYLDEEVREAPLREALGDSEEAARELARGLRHLAWIALALTGEAPFSPTAEDLGRALHRAREEAGPYARVEVAVEGGPYRVAGGGDGLSALLVQLLRLVALGASQGAVPRLRIHGEPGVALLSFDGAGEAIDPALWARLHEAGAQIELKESGAARSERFAPWLIVTLLARAIGAELERGEGGPEAPWLRLRLPLAGT